MKAIVQNRYGAPSEVLTYQEVPKPIAKDGEVVVRVRATSVHTDIWHVVTGFPYVLRLMGARRCFLDAGRWGERSASIAVAGYGFDSEHRTAQVTTDEAFWVTDVSTQVTRYIAPQASMRWSPSVIYSTR